MGKQDVAVHTLNANPWEAQADGSLWNLSQSHLNSEF